MIGGLAGLMISDLDIQGEVQRRQRAMSVQSDQSGESGVDFEVMVKRGFKNPALNPMGIFMPTNTLLQERRLSVPRTHRYDVLNQMPWAQQPQRGH